MALTILLLRSWLAVGLGCGPAVPGAMAGPMPGSAPRAASLPSTLGTPVEAGAPSGDSLPAGEAPGEPGELGELGDPPDRGAESPKPSERRRAARNLAAEGTGAAWRRLFLLLGDTESEVADEAQLLLQRLADPLLVQELAGKSGLASREAGVRRRAAEALGRVAAAVPVAPLLAALDDREREVSHLAAWSIERLAHGRRLLGDLDQAAGALELGARTQRDGLARASMVMACGALMLKAESMGERRREEFPNLLRRAREDRDLRVRCAALLASRALPVPSALLSAGALALDEEPVVRLARIELLEELACRESAAALIESLAAETFPRARTAIVRALQRMSGLKHREDPRPWRDWLGTLPPGWRPTLLADGGAAGRDRADSDGGGEARTQAKTNFVGLPLTSRRVCFAIDFSGSMWTPMPDGRLPKELVDARLRSTLESLPPDTRFNILPFTNEVLPWRPKVVPATAGHVRAAIADFESCKARGRGNFFDAALFALDDLEVDTLVTLSDGVPTGGFHSDLDLIVPLLVARNRFRRVAFDTVLVDAPQAFARRWQVLSDASGGRLVGVERAE